MAEAVTSNFPSGGIERPDLIGTHVIPNANIVIDDARHPLEVVPLHDRPGVFIDRFTAVVKRQEDRLGRQLRAFFDCLHKQFYGDRLVSPLI